MPTNLALDDQLIEQARRAGGHKTKREAVTAALRAYVKARRRGEMLELAGTVEFWPAFDHRSMRRRKSA
jgi:Arc/MetJ family transcription regulator